MKYVIVVARYNEDIEWTQQFKNVIIYNKGSSIAKSLPYHFQELFLENVGREGHTYYKHICDNYDSLDDYIVFLQGRPFDHSPSIVDNLNKYIEKIEKDEMDSDFIHLSECIYDTNLCGCPHHPNLPMANTYEKLFDERKEEMSFNFGAGAQFLVSKKAILKRPKEFYQKVVKMLECQIDPIEGYVIERFHSLIFK